MSLFITAFIAVACTPSTQQIPSESYVFNRINPVTEDIVKFGDAAPEGRIVMLNMVRLKSCINLRDWTAELMRLNRPFIPEATSQTLFISSNSYDLITQENWDIIFLIEYEKFADFEKVITHPDWIKSVAPFREKTIDQARLIVSVPIGKQIFNSEPDE